MNRVMSQNNSMFRYDINALRAFAVLIVVLFHFQIPYFSAGFIGVDVFFVISGFLMTGIVCKAVANERFSFLNFYVARARRIWPALIVLSLAVLVLGWFILMSADYKTLAAHARESLLFTSNLKYLSEAGYFDQASHSKWLLHTWSLSVEWQFYLIYPVLVVLFFKVFGKAFALRNLLAFHLFLIAVFFAVNLYYVSVNVEKAFYSLESRAWEMLLGGLAYFAGQRGLSQFLRNLLLWLGLSLLAVSLWVISPSQAWPGHYALLPTLGALAVILAARNGFFARLGFMQWVGERSYSIYLWHWPLVVLLTYYSLDSIFYSVLFIVLSLLLGHLSFWLVETPTRKKLSSVGVRSNVAYLMVFLLFAVALALVVRRDGIPSRLPESIASIEAMGKDKNPRQKECLTASASCVFGGEAVAAVVVGDSHADAIVSGVAAALSDEKQGVVLRAASGCLLAKGAQLVKERDTSCEAMVDNIASEIVQHYPGIPVLVTNRWPFYLYGEPNRMAKTGVADPKIKFENSMSDSLEQAFDDGVLNRLCAISKTNPTYVLRTVPEMPFDVPKEMAKSALRGQDFSEVKMSKEAYQQRNLFVDTVLSKAEAQCGVRILNPESYLCDEGFCYGARKDQALYVDDDHLSETGNKVLSELFKQIFAS